MTYISVLVLSICASFLLPSVVPASIYNQQITRTKRDNEIFDENFLPHNSIQLSVTPVAQSLQNSCGPTVAFALLRFLGYRSLSTIYDVSGEISGNLCIDGLIIRMWTQPYGPAPGGTGIIEFVNTINREITGRNLNNLRQYSAIQLFPSALSENNDAPRVDYTANYLLIARYVYNSLVNRAPVVLGFHGRFNPSEAIRSHFILITGITIINDGATFNYMDPDGGHLRTFGHNQLNNLLINGGYLVAHTPPVSGSPDSSNGSPTSGNGERNCPKATAYGGVAGTTGGIIAGAITGSAIPVVGTFIGGAAGAMFGLLMGSIASGVACVAVA